MTPFGTLLRFHRESRGYKQREFATCLGITNRVLSAVETGRRSPPDDKTMARIKSTLELSDDEFVKLKEAADNSAFVVRIPRDYSPERVALVHQFVSSLSRLRRDKIAIIRRALENDENSSIY